MVNANGVIVVTGATGHVGSKLVGRLLEKRQKVRAIARQKEKLETLSNAAAEILPMDLLDMPALTRAFSGSKAVFVMIPPQVTAPDVHAYYERVSQSAVTAVKNAEVEFVVDLSSVGAHLKEKTGPIVGLHDNEERLDQLPALNVLHLRAASFMENLLPQADLIHSMGIVGSPLRGDIKLPMIATRDIAAFAAERLAKLDFVEDGAQELLGQRDVTMEEVTQIIGQAIGRRGLKYVQFPYEEATKAFMKAGMSESYARGLVEMQRAMNEGILKPEKRRAPLNTTPTSIEEFVQTVFVPAYHQKETAGVR